MAPIFTAKVTVVLVEPDQAGNVGSVARAMDNLGASELRLVNPCEYMNSKGFAMATNSRWVLEKAVTFSTLREAVQDCKLIIGTSARHRQKHAGSASLWDIASIIKKYDTADKIAVVFGREASGLTNEEMDRCNEWIYIPGFGSTTSFNLAQAVILVLYELSHLNPRQESPINSPSPLADSFLIEGLKDHFFTVLKAVRFLRKGHEPVMRTYFSDLIARTHMTEHDVRIARGFFNKILLTIGAKKGRKKTSE